MAKGVAIQWLKQRLSGVSGLAQAYLFGSFYRGAVNPSDLDLVVVFDAPETVDNLVGIRKAFSEEFGLSLHIQKFYVQQAELIEVFLQRAGAWEKIYLPIRQFAKMRLPIDYSGKAFLLQSPAGLDEFKAHGVALTNVGRELRAIVDMVENPNYTAKLIPFLSLNQIEMKRLV